MIKQIIAYVLVVFGLPLLISTIVWFVPGVLLAGTIGKSHDRLESYISALGEGVIASVTGVLIFYWLKATPLWIVPILLSIVVITWNSTRKENFLNLPQIVGLAFGFIAMYLLIK